MSGRRFGVEEEFLLVHPDTGAPAGVAALVLRESPRSEPAMDKELAREQLEIGTAPVRTLAQLRAEIARLRSEASDAAQAQGYRLAAVGTSPVPAQPSTTPARRYERMIDLYRTVAAEQLACGMHVHVETDSPEEAVGALDRVRPWLAPLLALSANSPYWHGQDTGYESYRSQVWSRWPVAGPTEIFGSLGAYQQAVEATLATGTLLDDGMVYFDVRLGRGLPTLEVRVADVCLQPDDTALLGALTRALVDTAAREWRAGVAARPVRTEVLRLASFRAARSGLTGELVHPLTGSAAPAWEVIGAVVDHVRDALGDAGDAATVEDLLAQLRVRGTGAAAQRSAYARRDSLGDVALDAADRLLR